MNFKMVLHILGKVMCICAALMILPVIVALIYRENTLIAFAVPIFGLVITGFLLSFRKPENDSVYAKEGFFIVALAWIILSLFGSLPFYLIGEKLSFIDCLFETVSGFTTTGSSIFKEVEHLPKSILFWRSFTHWIGGMGVLVFVLAVLPKSDFTSMHLLRAEVTGPQVGKIVAKMKFTVRILYGIYIVMTFIQIILLIIGDMPVFDSIVHTFGTAGTGGFSIKNASIGAYDSSYIDIVIGVFMLLYGINFNLFYLIIAGSVIQALKSEELRIYLLIIAVSSVLIAINVISFYSGFFESLRYSFFQVSSIITTTGYATYDFNKWPGFSKSLLVILMFFGACAGSTGGGIKISRIIVLFKSAISEIKHLLSRRSVTAIRLDGRALQDEVVRGISGFIAAFMFLAGFSLLLIALDNKSLVTTFTAVVACINNIGPGLDMVGPAGNFSEFSIFSKLVLIVDMLAGRLEVFPILMLFSPSAWKGR